MANTKSHHGDKVQEGGSGKSTTSTGHKMVLAECPSDASIATTLHCSSGIGGQGDDAIDQLGYAYGSPSWDQARLAALDRYILELEEEEAGIVVEKTGRDAEVVAAIAARGLGRRIAEVVAVAAVVIVIFTYAGVLQVLATMLQCSNFDYGVEGERRFLTADYSIDCDSRTYAAARALAQAGLVAVALGIPFLMWAIVKVVQMFSLEGDALATHALFFFATRGYREKLWAWEIYVLGRKGLMVLLSTLVPSVLL
jgi:hypothetical protein